VTARGTDGSSVPAWCWDEQDDYRDQTKHPAIARLGRSAHRYLVHPGDSTEDAAAAQQHRVQADQLEEFPHITALVLGRHRCRPSG
jgi:hypothetical protein